MKNPEFFEQPQNEPEKVKESVEENTAALSPEDLNRCWADLGKLISHLPQEQYLEAGKLMMRIMDSDTAAEENILAVAERAKERGQRAHDERNEFIRMLFEVFEACEKHDADYVLPLRDKFALYYKECEAKRQQPKPKTSTNEQEEKEPETIRLPRTPRGWSPDQN